MNCVGFSSYSLYRPAHVLFLRSYMVDAADPEKIEASKNELHNLLDKPQLQGIPVSTDGSLSVTPRDTIMKTSQNLSVNCEQLSVN